MPSFLVVDRHNQTHKKRFVARFFRERKIEQFLVRGISKIFWRQGHLVPGILFAQAIRPLKSVAKVGGLIIPGNADPSVDSVIGQSNQFGRAARGIIGVGAGRILLQVAEAISIGVFSLPTRSIGITLARYFL